MRNSWTVALVACGAAALIAFGSAWLETPDAFRATLAAFVTIAAGAVAMHLTRRSDIAAGAALLCALWPGRLWATTPMFAVALALVLLPLVPPTRRIVELLAAFVLSGLAAFLIANGNPITLAVGAFAAALLTAMRPQAPTVGNFRAIRFVSLYFPAAGIAGLLILNSVTDQGDRIGPSEAVPWALGVLVLLSLLAASGLGLERLLRSDARAQSWIWVALAIGGSVVVQSVPSRDPSSVLGATFMVAPVCAVLVHFFLAWVTRSFKGVKSTFFWSSGVLGFLGTLLFKLFISAAK